MQIQFIPTGTSGSWRRTRDICARAQSLEEVIGYWVAPDRDLQIESSKDENLVGLTFIEKLNPIGFASVSAQECISRSPKFEPLCEEIRKFCDQDGYTANEEWFDARNERMDIWFETELDALVLRPEHLSEILLSYLFSTHGFVHLSYNPPIKWEAIEAHIKIECEFASNKERSEGWDEHFAVNRRKLRAWVKKEKSIQAAPDTSFV